MFSTVTGIDLVSTFKVAVEGSDVVETTLIKS